MMDWRRCEELVYVSTHFESIGTDFADGLYSRVGVKEHNQRWLKNDWPEYLDDCWGHFLKGETLGKEPWVLCLPHKRCSVSAASFPSYSAVISQPHTNRLSPSDLLFQTKLREGKGHIYLLNMPHNRNSINIYWRKQWISENDYSGTKKITRIKESPCGVCLSSSTLGPLLANCTKE